MAAFKVILAAGGTGGHLWPAISLARAIRKREPDSEFLFIGTGRPIEEKMLTPEGFRRQTIRTSGLKGQGLLGALKALYYCLTSLFEARSIIRNFKPDLCFGAGGYVTVPVGLAAKMCGVPLVIHEQNSRPGLSNKVLGKAAVKIMLGFAEAAPAFRGDKTVFTGNPVRREITDLLPSGRSRNEYPVISITGGSQGASGLNRLAVKALIKLKRAGSVFFKVYHQSGASDVGWITEAYKEAGLEAEVQDFYLDMASFYARSDLIVARAGALTIAELTVLGMPSILVPLPTAADDHQTVNARRLEEHGAAVVLPEKTASPDDLTAILEELLADGSVMEKMSQAAFRLARPEADDDMARICLEVIGRS